MGRERKTDRKTRQHERDSLRESRKRRKRHLWRRVHHSRVLYAVVRPYIKTNKRRTVTIIRLRRTCLLPLCASVHATDNHPPPNNRLRRIIRNFRRTIISIIIFTTNKQKTTFPSRPRRAIKIQQ